jgi:hypothetical protein
MGGDFYLPRHTGLDWRITFTDANRDGTPERITLWTFSPQRGVTSQTFSTGLA